jgi:hypothetical protein
VRSDVTSGLRTRQELQQRHTEYDKLMLHASGDSNWVNPGAIPGFGSLYIQLPTPMRARVPVAEIQRRADAHRSRAGRGHSHRDAGWG